MKPQRVANSVEVTHPTQIQYERIELHERSKGDPALFESKLARAGHHPLLDGSAERRQTSLGILDGPLPAEAFLMTLEDVGLDV